MSNQKEWKEIGPFKIKCRKSKVTNGNQNKSKKVTVTRDTKKPINNESHQNWVCRNVQRDQNKIIKSTCREKD